MSKTTINNDAFLRLQGIEVEQSRFLRKVLHKKQAGNKQQYNLRDLHGRRLGNNWQPGDNILSVAKKIFITRVLFTLDPDTYTQETLKESKEYILRQKIKIMGVIICLFFPISLYFNAIKPRLDHVKRQYFLQFYNKMGFFNRQLGIKTKKVSQKDLEDSL